MRATARDYGCCNAYRGRRSCSCSDFGFCCVVGLGFDFWSGFDCGCSFGALRHGCAPVVYQVLVGRENESGSVIVYDRCCSAPRPLLSFQAHWRRQEQSRLSSMRASSYLQGAKDMEKQ